VASANCAIYCGATPGFIDVDPLTYNVSIRDLENRLAKAAEQGKIPKVVIPVHFAGQSCEMEEICDMGKKYNFKIIEDACHAVGGSYKGVKIGKCLYSDMTVFSFHPVKNITTGEGGMVLTNNEKYYERLKRLRNHGITRDERFMDGRSEGAWYYQQIELGFNYRITDFQAALGLSQLRKIDSFVARRREIAGRYDASLKELPVTLPYQHRDAYSSYHVYVIRIRSESVTKTRKDIFNALMERGIGVNIHYIPVHLQTYYRNLGFSRGDYPEAERYYSEAITLPLYPLMTEKQQDYIINILKEVLS
jgi:UDP-4-amino-4,6-dideoxy-N-acetyl-beta-L-altrosamine transaminase